MASFATGAKDGDQSVTSVWWAERFSALLRDLEFLPNSPMLMNAGTNIGLLSVCLALPVEN
ncbi:hypothetical protein DIJ64_11460 [Mycobacterium leprae]|uniref:U650l n=1 Tax=Mycobacterium leprae TaxID=1769 RepID=Q50104_MYCLR|nr:ribonucleotide reductase N-terminal alpha domain-containing protein [Mycobacterium leprae]AAA63066.1 u650l [Mycobacterium leprae]AWV48455.1 hypothetical protein DIJ64_11460 [Mycobacterium leprae]OAR20181.1 hypothetical protein A8144_11840 [Mycobacterium leprae 3125609]OAX70559.1 hypothetical protein A3216_11265 [Mycobacterium leprae 7935681]